MSTHHTRDKCDDCNVSRRSLPGSTAGVEDSVFAPDWLLAQLAEYFSPWLPPAQLQAFTQEAAYTFSWRPGFRVISAS